MLSMNVQRIKIAYSKDIQELLESLNINSDNIDLFIQLMIDEGFITEDTHPWAFENDEEDNE